MSRLSSQSLLLATRLAQYSSGWQNIWTQLDAGEYFQHVQQRVGSTRSPMSKCIFYGPLITQANHFSVVSRGTMTPLMNCIPARDVGGRSDDAVLNLDDRAPVGVPPTPQPPLSIL